MKTPGQNIMISEAVVMCTRAGIKVYPVVEGRKFKVAVQEAGKDPKVFDKLVDPGDLNAALSKTYKHYAIKIIRSKYAESTKQ